MEVRTARLAEDLLGYLGCYQALEFDPPTVPAPIADTEQAEADSRLFTFQSLENGWLVSGLTEAGKAETSLTLPASYRGEPVVGFTAEAFAGSTNLTELILPASVEYIPDGAFSGCGSLTRRVLLHTGKTPGLGKDPFAGAEGLRIFVPLSAYPLYRDGAGCATNPWEAYLDCIDNLKDCLIVAGVSVTGFAPGFSRTDPAPKPALIEEAAALAKTAEVVLLCVGLDEIAESEGLDRVSMELSKGQQALIDAVRAVNENIILVLSGGAPFVMPEADTYRAAIHGYLGGQADAGAMADALLGKINPSGKLNET